MVIVVDIILPVFGILIFAYAVARCGLFNVAATAALSNFVFNFALPAMLFRTLATTAMPEHFAWGLIFSYYGGVVAVFALAMAVGRLVFGRKLDGQGVVGMTAGYANLVLIGIPLILTALGDKGAVPLFVIVGLNSLVLYSIATIVIETGRGSREGLARLPYNVIRGLVTNPIVMSMVIGFACGIAGLRPPGPLDTLLKTFGLAASPCALFAMGATLAQYRIAGNIAEFGDPGRAQAGRASADRAGAGDLRVRFDAAPAAGRRGAGRDAVGGQFVPVRQPLRDRRRDRDHLDFPVDRPVDDHRDDHAGAVRGALKRRNRATPIGAARLLQGLYHLPGGTAFLAASVPLRPWVARGGRNRPRRLTVTDYGAGSVASQ